MLRLLRICLAVLGVSAIAIAAMILALGPEATASMFEGVFGAVAGGQPAAAEPWSATMDSELRFYAVLWGAYGVVVLRTALRVRQTLSAGPWLAAIFFLGGCGRLVSRVAVGKPHPFFTLLMVIELALPVLMILLWLRARSTPHAPKI